MGAKWSTVSTSTYADGSPSDDGSPTEANKVKFATIKTDLTDPLDTAIDSIVAKLDQLFSESTTPISTNYTTTASDHSRILEVTGSKTITLLAAATAGAGYRVGVNASGGNCAIAGSGAELIEGAGTIVVPRGGTTWVTVNGAGTGWIVSVASTRMRTGTYSGDGGISLAITALGGRPQVLAIIQATGDGVASVFAITTAPLMALDAQGLAIAFSTGAVTNLDNRILSLDADGFTISDDGTDAFPNATGVAYAYIAWF